MKVINLERLSSISIAVRIWEYPSVKTQAIKLLQVWETLKRTRGDLHVFPYREIGIDDDFELIISSAVDLLNSLKLPSQVKKNCGNVIREIGEKIYAWIDYVICVLNFNFKFALQICWKSDGRIDEEKIFKSWELDEEFVNQRHLGREALYILACFSANEDSLTKNQFEMEKILKKMIPDFNLNNYEDKIYSLLILFLYYHYLYRRNVEEWDIDYANRDTSRIISNNPSQIICVDDILQLCVNAGCTKAFYYIWNVYSPKNEKLLIPLILWCLHKTHDYQKEKSAEILIFLLNQMTQEQKFLLFQEKVKNLFFQIAPAFPDHEIISELITNHLSNISLSDYESIILCILNQLKNVNSKTEKFHELFHKIFTSRSSELKNDSCRIFYIFFYLSDLECFKIVMNSMGDNFKIKVKENVELWGVEQIQMGKSGWLKGFMIEILKTDAEREAFKEKILNSINEIIVRAWSFKEVDKLLDILSDTNEERSRLKNRINSDSVFEKFSHAWSWEYREYDRAEKFLEWRFDNKEDLENFRKSYNRYT